ncbi:LysR family transcriptional regulator ArgP [Defluviimonas sp. D31]|uniref:LysR family transcriptional regulator ArgP n=1 Tax=Defluviimonas sp. D31 TaxID=3083253 RepID=UPI00296EA3C3|nr:LysR family transcriptional regulator ArgP [Defluviimonas sp. D31]MDW4548068.1 LysR family transcriptional regulator ArgP [Defluviimonas sp. D31]
MLEPAQLQALAAILRTGSFDAAAAALHVTPSAISQRLKALEERLGTVLVSRGQPARATTAGARLARHFEDVQLLEHALATDLGAELAAERPTVRIAVNADSLATWVLPALAAVPDLLYELVIDDQDHSANWLRRGEVQAAVTAHDAPVAGCDSHPLGQLRCIASASPAFIARWFADGVTAEALGRAPALTFNEKDRLPTLWALRVTGRRIAPPSHYLASSRGHVDAARLGLGWGMNPEPLIRRDLAAGELAALVPDAPLDIALYWQVGRLTGAAMAPLTRAIRAQAASVLLPPVPA